MNNAKRCLTLADREEISRGIWAKETFSQIAERINFYPSAVSREVWRNVQRKGCYSAVKAQEKADLAKKNKGRKKKLSKNEALKNYVYERLKREWSPEEIANRLKLDYSKDKHMRISHEAIYQHLYCLPKGELKKELIKGLRQEKKRRISRKNLHYRKQRIQDLISISERPKEAEGRTVPGHWEGDLVMGRNRSSAVGTLVERTTRLILLAPLKEKDAFAVRTAFAKSFKRIPGHIKKSLTYDRGSEMAQHKLFTKETKIQVFFADPHSPWQRGTNENTNGLIRQYFPKGKVDFREVSLRELKMVEDRLNNRPRKALGYLTPLECFYKLIKNRNFALKS